MKRVSSPAGVLVVLALVAAFGLTDSASGAPSPVARACKPSLRGPVPTDLSVWNRR